MKLDNNDPRVRDLASSILEVEKRREQGESAQALIDEVDDLVFCLTCAVDEYFARREQLEGARRVVRGWK